MKEKHTVLCVDDEENILSSLRRLLRKEPYRVLTAMGGEEGLRVLRNHEVHLVMTDQRMSEMGGIEFLAKVKEEHPDIVRIILTGYTDVDSIMESINKGNIYKFFLKPWNDQNLKVEIRKALERYDLIQANKRLNDKILEQNQELKRINENLEVLVQERTKELEIQNQALELSHAILEDIPVPIIGISAEGTIVLTNQEAQAVASNGKGLQIGKKVSEYFPREVEEKICAVLKDTDPQELRGLELWGFICNMDFRPLSGRFRGKGVILTVNYPSSA